MPKAREKEGKGGMRGAKRGEQEEVQERTSLAKRKEARGQARDHPPTRLGDSDEAKPSRADSDRRRTALH